MPLFTSLLLLLVLARLLGELTAKFKQPPIVGEMLAGVILGPSILNMIHPTPALSGISELGVFLIVLSAGLEMNFKDIVRALRGKGLIIALIGFFIPLLSGILIGIAFQLDVMRTIFLGLCISITALPVAIRILESFKILDTEIARYSIATAIINDLAALLALGVILSLPTEAPTFSGVAFSVIVTSGKLMLLAGVILGIYAFLGRLEKNGVRIQSIPERLILLFGSEALFGIVILFVLVFASISETLGFHFVIGAFFGALLINKEYFLASRFSELEKTINSVNAGFLAPLFFAFLGLEFNILTLTSFEFVVTVLVVSIVSKLFSGWIGGRMVNMSTKDSLGLGIILNGRGVMELVVASIAYNRGFISQDLFSTLILMGVVTTMITPLLYKKLLNYYAVRV